MPSYYKTYERQFDWKYEAENFVAKIKRATKKLPYNVTTKILPLRAFSSSSAQRWNWRDKLRGEKAAETKTVAYVVRWMYKPGKKTMRSDIWLKHKPEVRQLVARHTALSFPMRTVTEKLTISKRIAERYKISNKLSGWGFHFYDYQIKQLTPFTAKGMKRGK